MFSKVAEDPRRIDYQVDSIRRMALEACPTYTVLYIDCINYTQSMRGDMLYGALLWNKHGTLYHWNIHRGVVFYPTNDRISTFYKLPKIKQWIYNLHSIALDRRINRWKNKSRTKIDVDFADYSIGSWHIPKFSFDTNEFSTLYYFEGLGREFVLK